MHQLYKKHQYNHLGSSTTRGSKTDMLLTRDKILSIWGGVSPKLFDGDFLKLRKNYIDNTFHGEFVIEYNHFSWGR
jgi:hypothetical protein